MPALIGFIIVCVLFANYWQHILAAAVVIGAIWFMLDYSNKLHIAAQKDQAERERLRREEEARVAAHKIAQQGFRTELGKVTDLSLQTFEALPGYLLRAESLLDQAEQDFREGAFAPFWDSIEEATMRLGNFDAGIFSINHNLKRYDELSRLYEDKSPRFPIAIKSVKGMVAGNATAERMKALVRQAQRNFQFASIYEQRKTNQILIAGFRNLAQALNGMGQRISESIDGLSEQVSDMSSSLKESMASLGEQMITASSNISESVQELHSTVQREDKVRAERHDRALEMLDNIQRRRMPTGFHSDFGTKPAPQ